MSTLSATDKMIIFSGLCNDPAVNYEILDEIARKILYVEHYAKAAWAIHDRILEERKARGKDNETPFQQLCEQQDFEETFFFSLVEVSEWLETNQKVLAMLQAESVSELIEEALRDGESDFTPFIIKDIKEIF